DACRAGAGVDVGDVVLVADQRDASEGNGLGGRRPVGVDGELLGLEVGEQVVGGDLVELVRQVVVHPRLGRGRRAGVGLVLAGREDVARDDRRVPASSASALLLLGGCGRRQRRDDGNQNQRRNQKTLPAHLLLLSPRPLTRRGN